MSEARRHQFAKWLLKAWEWAADNNRTLLAVELEELVGHADELDYPLWTKAKAAGVIGEGKVACMLADACGLPHQTPDPTGWEKQINHEPVIRLEKAVWEDVYSRLGWANRNIDGNCKDRTFYLWSPAGNMVRFVVKEPVVMVVEDDQQQT